MKAAQKKFFQYIKNDGKKKRGRRKFSLHILSTGLSIVIIGGLLPFHIAQADVTDESIKHSTIGVSSLYAESESSDDFTNQSYYMLGDKLNLETIKQQGKIYSNDESVFLADMTNSAMWLGINIEQRIAPAEFTRLMASLFVVRYFDVNAEVTISAEAAKLSKENRNLTGFKLGDKIKLGDLLKCYYLTGNADAELALAENTTGSISSFVKKMNSLAKKIGADNTYYVNMSGESSKKSFTTVYDTYVILYELLQEDWFAEVFGRSEEEIFLQSADGVNYSVSCIDQNANEYSKIEIPDDFSYAGQLTASTKDGSNNQIILTQNQNGNIIVSIIMRLSSNEDISKYSATVLGLFHGGTYPVEGGVIGIGVTPGEVIEQLPQPTPIPDISEKAKIPTADNDARYQYLFGTDAAYYTMNNRPVGFESAQAAARHMTTITVPVWKMSSSGGRYASAFRLTINKKLKESVIAIFDEIYALDLKFPIHVLKGYGYRKVGGVGLTNVTLMSMHSFGAAIDINPGDFDNDYFLGKGNDLRDKSNPLVIPDEVIEIFERYGWFWGGNFNISADTMHFQYLGLEFLSYQGKYPFRTLSLQGNTQMRGTDVKNLQQRLRKLGFQVSIDGVYGKSTESVIRKAQQTYGIPVTGIVDQTTWETIINKTHYMPYIF